MSERGFAVLVWAPVTKAWTLHTRVDTEAAGMAVVREHTKNGVRAVLVYGDAV